MFAICEKGLRPCMSIFRSLSKILSSKLSSKDSTQRSESVLSLAKYMFCKFYYLFISFVFLGHPRHRMGIIFRRDFWVAVISLLSFQEKECAANLRFGKMMWRLPKAPLAFNTAGANASSGSQVLRGRTAQLSLCSELCIETGFAEPTSSQCAVLHTSTRHSCRQTDARQSVCYSLL